MKKKNKKTKRPDHLRREYNFSKITGGVRGKYLDRYQAGTNLILLSPDVAKFFPDDQSVNTALRSLITSSRRPRRSR